MCVRKRKKSNTIIDNVTMQEFDNINYFREGIYELCNHF